MFIKKALGFILIFVFLFSLKFPVSAAVDEPETFLTTLNGETTLNLQSLRLKNNNQRIQPVKFNFEQLHTLENQLKSQPTQVSLQIFPDLSIDAQFTQIETSITQTKVFSGIIDNNPENYILLAETAGSVIGEIVYQYTKYQLRQEEGQYYFIEIDQSLFPSEAEPVLPALDGLDSSLTATTLDNQVTADSGALIDVMVVYTGTARSAQGGTANMENLISLAIAETNTGYLNSGINHRMRLVHTEEVSYSESDFDWETALYRLQGKTDGYVDNVHTLRDLYGADLVVMIVANGDYCGIGFLLKTLSTSYDQLGFSIVSDGCATGYYSLGHETGHNLGAHHDRETCDYYNSGQGLYAYSYGYIVPDDSFRTIMAYGLFCNNCQRINRWSNPDQTYNNFPLGIEPTNPDSADNRLTLNNSAYTVANYRQEIGIIAPTNLQSTTIHSFYVSLSFTDNSLNESGFILERSPNGTSWAQIADLPSNTTTYTDLSVTCETPYIYRVRSYTDQLESTPSNSLSVETNACIPPDAPTQPTGIPQLFSVILKWTNTLWEDNYRIQQSPDGINNWSNIQYLPADSTSTTIPNLSKGTTYYFRIGAENEYGINYTGTITVTTHTEAVYLPLTLK